MKLASYYVPLSLDINRSDLFNKKATKRGSTPYFIQCIGGKRGLAQLYLETGLLFLDGAATSLLASSHSSLSSIRIGPQPTGDGGQAAWRRDRDTAMKYFDRARELAPELDIPVLPAQNPLYTDDLEMPSIELQMDVPDINALRRRRRREEKALLNNSSKVQDLDGAWYVYLPGIIGAGTALVAVGVIGALGFSWSRRNQSA